MDPLIWTPLSFFSFVLPPFLFPLSLLSWQDYGITYLTGCGASVFLGIVCARDHTRGCGHSPHQGCTHLVEVLMCLPGTPLPGLGIYSLLVVMLTHLATVLLELLVVLGAQTQNRTVSTGGGIGDQTQGLTLQ